MRELLLSDQCQEALLKATERVVKSSQGASDCCFVLDFADLCGCDFSSKAFPKTR